MVSISTADMTIIIAENALKMKLLHENITSFANVGNSNVLMKKSNSRFLEDFSIKETHHVPPFLVSVIMTKSQMNDVDRRWKIKDTPKN
jgi:hypothetical protein